MELVTATNPKFLKWLDQILDATLGKIPTRSTVTDRGGTPHIDKYFLGYFTRVMGSSIGAMIQAQQSQHQPTVVPSAQAGRREFYSDCALAALMEYAQVYTESGIPIIWGKFQMSKECADNIEELLSGMMYWAKTNGIEIYTAVFFFKLAIKDMVKTNLD